jgi:hypothetical protein
MSENAWLRQVLADARTARESRLGFARNADNQTALHSAPTPSAPSTANKSGSSSRPHPNQSQQNFSFEADKK